MTQRLRPLLVSFSAALILAACAGNDPLPIPTGLESPTGAGGEDRHERAGTPPSTTPRSDGSTSSPPTPSSPPPVPPSPGPVPGVRDAGAGADAGREPLARICGGLAGFRCADGQFCDVPGGTCGAADQTGTCRTRPDVCTLQYAPVCGCDGKTYGNDCQRAGAGVSKLHDGECKTAGTREVGPGESCGGLVAGPIPVCKKGLFCETKAETCGLIADAPGICVEQPAVCTKEYAPVCGCNGTTYGNDCMRRAAGVSLKHKGACQTEGGGVGAACGGIAGRPCAAGLICDQEPGFCKGADIAGTCKERPSACTREYRPVCGCDGKTYGNECTRLASGVAKAHDGACATPPPPPPPPPANLLPAGTWGGEHIALTVRDAVAGATVKLDCAAGTITGPLEVQTDGQFKWRGTYTGPLGGPDPAAPRPALIGATYHGRLSGEVMSLAIYPDGRPMLKFDLALGKTPLLFRCL